jgi:hypothetical protein
MVELMATEFVYRDCRVSITFEIAGRHRYHGVAIIIFNDAGAKLAHEVRTQEAFDDWSEASRRVEQLARQWIDGKRG